MLEDDVTLQDALPTESGDFLAQQLMADESAAESQADLLEASVQVDAAWSQLEVRIISQPSALADQTTYVQNRSFHLGGGLVGTLSG